MILAACELLAGNADPTEAEIRRSIAGNLCRCTGYQHIVAAVRNAAGKMRSKKVQAVGGRSERPAALPAVAKGPAKRDDG